MKPIPVEAMPVVRKIREHVKKPLHSRFWPVNHPQENTLRMKPRKIDKLRHGMDECCPMGLLPYASSDTPAGKCSLPGSGLTNNQVLSFYEWWDAIHKSDAKAAVDAVWGTK